MNDYKVKVKGKRFLYRTNIKLTEKGEGIIESGNKPFIELSTPVEFGGKPAVWTPEDLLVASVNACIMTTFSYYAVKRGFKFVSYESSAEGVLEKEERGLVFSCIEVVPEISVKLANDVERTRDLLALSEKNCLISNSIKSKVTVKAKIQAVSI